MKVLMMGHRTSVPKAVWMPTPNPSEHGRKELIGEWKVIRRGWGLSGETFREKLLASVGQQLTDKKRETYEGEEKRAHDEKVVSAMLVEGQSSLGLTVNHLTLKKSDKRKQVLG